MDMTPNRPEVVEEVRILFERYEEALTGKDVGTLDLTFWDSPHTIRYALKNNCYGFAEVHAARVAAPKVPGGGKEIRYRLEILTLGTGFATVNLEYKARGHDGTGRQSQTWVRFPDVGWKVVAAHVSILPKDGWSVV